VKNRFARFFIGIIQFRLWPMREIRLRKGTVECARDNAASKHPLLASQIPNKIEIDGIAKV
jgi:hypothetical protein